MKCFSKAWHKKKNKLHSFLKGKLCCFDLLKFFGNQKDQKFFSKLPGFAEKCALTRGLKEV